MLLASHPRNLDTRTYQQTSPIAYLPDRLRRSGRDPAADPAGTPGDGALAHHQHNHVIGLGPDQPPRAICQHPGTAPESALGARHGSLPDR